METIHRECYKPSMFDSIPPLETLHQAHPQAVSTFFAALGGNRLHHAYLLMCNQTGTARALALAVGQALVCSDLQGGARPCACQRCPGCRKFAAGNHPDTIIIEPNEKRLIPIADVRELSSRLHLRATESKTRVVLFFEADHMNPAAQNAVLKTLEEPPGDTCFLLTGRRYRQFLPTIRSRVQRIQLAPPSLEQTQRLLEQAGVPAAISGPLAALVGCDTELAERRVEEGAEQVLDELVQLLSDPSLAAVLDLAGDLGTSKERSAIALELMEIFTRDGLAKRWGARDDQLYRAENALKQRGSFDAAAAQLQNLRRNQLMTPNKTMSTESVLLRLTQPSAPKGRGLRGAERP